MQTKRYPRFPSAPRGTSKGAIDYARRIVSGKIKASAQVAWECDRFLRRVRSRNWRYDLDTVESIGKFCELLPHPEGEWDSPTVRLAPWQKLLIASVYGWREADNLAERAVRECMLAVPRKAGKSAFAAFLALADLTIANRNSARIVAAGPTERQAKFPFAKALAVVRRAPKLAEAYGLRASELLIRRRDALGGEFVTTSGKEGTQDGENPTMVIYEETHAEKNPNLLGVHRSSFGARRNPLLFLPTTAGDTPMSVGLDERDTYIRMTQTRDGSAQMFGLLYEASLDDDPSSPAVWRKAQPSLGLTVSRGFYRHMHDAAIGNESKMDTFRTRQLNVWKSGGTKSAFDMEQVLSLPAPAKGWRDTPRLQRAWIGVDLSERDDLASITLLGEHDGSLSAWWEIWVPGIAADLAEKGRLTRGVGGQSKYAKWIKSGALKRSRTRTIDYGEIAEVIAAICERHNVSLIVSDYYAGVHELYARLPVRLAERLQRGRKTASNFTAPTKDLLRRIEVGGIALEKNPVAQWCFASCVAEHRIDGSFLIKKETEGSPDKIDAVDSLVLAMMGRTAQIGAARQTRGPLGIAESGILGQGVNFY